MSGLDVKAPGTQQQQACGVRSRCHTFSHIPPIAKAVSNSYSLLPPKASFIVGSLLPYYPQWLLLSSSSSSPAFQLQSFLESDAYSCLP